MHDLVDKTLSKWTHFHKISWIINIQLQAYNLVTYFWGVRFSGICKSSGTVTEDTTRDWNISITFLVFQTVFTYCYAKPPAILLWFYFNYRVSFYNFWVSSVTPFLPQLCRTGSSSFNMKAFCTHVYSISYWLLNERTCVQRYVLYWTVV